MKKKFFRTILSLTLVGALLGCNLRKLPNKDNTPYFAKNIKIGTFNIYWLNQIGKETNFLSPGRNSDDFQMIAGVIKDTEADLLVLEEISSNQALNELVQTLNQIEPESGWTNKTVAGEILRGKNSDGSESNNQEVSVIYKSRLIEVTGKKHRFDLMADPNNDLLREPLMLHVRVKNSQKATDFDLIGVHLKSFGGSTWKESKEKELNNLTNWIINDRQELSEDADHLSWEAGIYDPDLVILGDFNAPMHRDGDDKAKIAHDLVKKYFGKLAYKLPIYPMDAEGKPLNSYIHPKYGSVIDIMYFSPEMYKLVADSANIYEFDKIKDLSKLRDAKKKSGSNWIDIDKYIRVSDHRPVTVDLFPID